MIRELASAALASATRVAGKAAEKAMEHPRGQEAVARAVGIAQRGKRLMDHVQERTFHAVGLAARRDHEDLRKQIARIKRKARELGERLEEPARQGPASPATPASAARTEPPGDAPATSRPGGDPSRG